MAFPPTDWLDWTPAEYDVGAPATSLSFERWFRNPVAMAQGDPGSPILGSGWHPYNSTEVGDASTGRIWSFAVDGAVASVTSPDFEDGFEYRFRIDSLIGNEPSINLYRQTSAAYAGASRLFDIYGVVAATRIHGRIDILRPREPTFIHTIETALVPNPTGAGVGAPPADSVTGFNAGYTPLIGFINHATAQKILRVQFANTASNFTDGGIYMYRRLCNK